MSLEAMYFCIPTSECVCYAPVYVSVCGVRVCVCACTDTQIQMTVLIPEEIVCYGTDVRRACVCVCVCVGIWSLSKK